MYLDMSAEAVVKALDAMPKGERHKAVQKLIYKKGQRPTDLRQQTLLLDHLSQDAGLQKIDRIYALIAGAHKVCEQVLTDEAEHWSARLEDALITARAMPYSFGLRKDRTHLVFSLLNVALNVDLLAGGTRLAAYAQATFEEVDRLKLHKMTPYLFNSTSNVVKAVGIALLQRPADLPKQTDLMLRLMSFGIEINNPVYWRIFRRFQAPRALAQVKTRAAYESFRNSMRRLDRIEEAANAPLPDRPDRLRAVAEACLAQSNDAQKAALLAAVETHLAPSW